MIFRTVFGAGIVAVALLVAGCGEKKNSPVSKDGVKVSMSDSTDYELKAVFNKQIQALKAKNPSDYITTLRITGLDSINALHYFESITQLYDLNYTIRDFKVLRNDGKTAEVEVEMEVRKVNGPAFEDHIAVTRHILAKSGEGKWVIVESHEMKFTKLDHSNPK